MPCFGRGEIKGVGIKLCISSSLVVKVVSNPTSLNLAFLTLIGY